MDTTVALFTRDLRVHDHSALESAARDGGQVVPLFVLDDALLRAHGAPNRVAFLLGCVRDLDASLRARGAPLVLRRGDPVRQTVDVAQATGATAVHLSGDVSGYARRRQERLRAACAERGIAVHSFPGITAVAPGALRPAGADHFSVFSPYWRRWRAELRGRPLPAPRRLRAAGGSAGDALPALDTLAGRPVSPQLPEGGETAGRHRLDRWLARGLARYGERRDDLGADATSRLSPYLHLGCLSAHEIAQRATGRDGAEPFLRQLCWRDFYAQLLAAEPNLARRDLRPRGVAWRDDEAALDAWREGRTGYPIVDAGMRQLRQEGWMPNRARLVTASFLVKDLGLDWRLGAAHFFDLLVDGDLASNAGNWQWTAGTGIDARPQRILNPTLQARRFDPRGDYVRRHVPELAGVEGGAVHEPWKLEASLLDGVPDYPRRIVVHEDAARALRASQAR